VDILFLGRKKYAADMLEWTVAQGHNVIAVVTDNHIPSSPTAARSKALKIPVIDICQAEDLVAKINIDIAISYLYWRKIKEPIITCPRFGCINFHPAILPDWKGVAGYNIAILNKLSEWGVSAHVVDKEIDTGPIIKVFRFNFDYRFETALSLEKKTQEIQCELYKSVLADIHNNDGLSGSFISNEGGMYISRKEMLEMMKICPDEDIALKVRAFWYPPHHGAFIEINGEKYTLIDDLILQQISTMYTKSYSN